MSTRDEHRVDNPVDKFAAALSSQTPAEDRQRTRAIYLQPILCVDCPTCHSRVHPRVRTFDRHEGYDVIRGMCPFCGSVNWVFNREQERRADSPSIIQQPRKRKNYVYRA